MGKFEWIATKNPCIDEFWPLEATDRLPNAIVLGWTWTGSNCIGLFYFGRCLLGIEWRLGDEPSFGIVINNREYGFWFPDDE